MTPSRTAGPTADSIFTARTGLPSIAAQCHPTLILCWETRAFVAVFAPRSLSGGQSRRRRARTRLRTPRGSCGWRVSTGNCGESCQPRPSFLAKGSICIQTEECNYSWNLWSNTAAGPGPSPPLQILSLISKANTAALVMDRLPRLGLRVDECSVRELMVQTCSSQPGAEGLAVRGRGKKPPSAPSRWRGAAGAPAVLCCSSSLQTRLSLSISLVPNTR